MALPIQSKYVGPVPAAAGIEEQGLGWKSTFGTGNGDNTISRRPGRCLVQNTNEMEQ